MTTPPQPTIDLLLNLIDTRPAAILQALTTHPHLASAQDAHGYSLLHAAVSYNQPPVLHELLTTYATDVNLLDEDGESPLFAAEIASIARSLVERYNANWQLRNSEGKTAEEKITEEEGPEHEVVVYLRSLRGESADGAPAVAVADGMENGVDAQAPSSLPNGFKVNVEAMAEEEMGDAPDPEFRRRIEELAAREDFHTEEGQRRLRELVTEAVTGIGAEDAGRSVRRRVD